MEDLQWCLDGNLKTTFMMTQACLPYLEESKGQIINMSSFSGSRPVSIQSIIPEAAVFKSKCMYPIFSEKGMNAIAMIFGVYISEQKRLLTSRMPVDQDIQLNIK